MSLAHKHMLIEPDPGPNELNSQSGHCIRTSILDRNRKFSIFFEIDKYGTPRFENAFKSISKLFPIDWDTSQTPESNHIFPNRSQLPGHAPTKVSRPNPSVGSIVVRLCGPGTMASNIYGHSATSTCWTLTKYP